MVCIVAEMINTCFWPSVSTLFDKITGDKGSPEGFPLHGVYCAFCWILTTTAIIIVLFAPFNKWYNWS